MLSAAVLGLVSPAMAQNVWTGAISSDWLNGGNWSTGLYPGDPAATDPANRDVRINALLPHSPVIDGGDPASFGSMPDALAIGTSGAGRLDIMVRDSFFMGIPDVAIGLNGHSGTLTFDLRQPTPGMMPNGQVYFNQAAFGVGPGSVAQINVLGNGKTIQQQSSYQSNAVALSFTTDTVFGDAGGSAVINVDGAGFGVSYSGGGVTFARGAGSTATLNVLNAGKVFLNNLYQQTYGFGVGGGAATLNIDGVGADGTPSRITIRNRDTVFGDGAGSRGTLNVLGGGKALSFRDSCFEPTPCGSDTLGQAGGTGVATISGAGSVWYIMGETDISFDPANPQMGLPGSLHVGGPGGTGVLTLADGGRLSLGRGTILSMYDPDISVTNWYQLGTFEPGQGILYVAQTAGSAGTVNFGAPAGSAPVAPGVLEAAAIEFGDGNGRVVFNHTSDAFDFAIPTSGPGVVQTLAGTTVFTTTGAMTYSGQTLVDGGTLRAGAIDAFSPLSQHVVGPAGTLDLAGYAQTIPGLTNAGLVQLGGAPGNTLTVAGNYVGAGGTVSLNTVLGGDGSPSDRLVIQGGSATGSTALRIVRAGGDGELTTANGILVVQATDGGTTAPGAFALSGRVAAGAYDYRLFRGGPVAGQGVGESWYLRSTLIPVPPSPPDPPTVGPIHPPLEPVPPPGGGGPGVPLYRPEVALVMPLPSVARQMGVAMLGTLHERVGEEENIREQASSGSGYFVNGAWARAFGQRMTSRWAGTVDARADDANLVGMQAGLDIFRRQSDAGHRDHAGLYLAYGDYNGRISGFADAVYGARVGRLEVDGPAVGAYWTHFGPSGWYVDAIAQMNWFDAKGQGLDGNRVSTSGTGFAASLEAGYPIRLSAGWQIEPQAQVIWQTVSVDDTRDAYSTVSWEGADAVTGRVGARLQYTGRDGATLWQPYGKVNLWHGLSGTDHASFDDDRVDSRFGGTSIEAGAGVTAKIAAMTSLYAHLDQSWNLGGSRERTNVTQGAIGIRVNW